MDLPPRQQQILDAIAAHWKAKGYAPSFREIADEVGIASTNGVSDHVKALVRKGLLLHDPRVARSVRLVSRRGDDDRS